jgi:hypothetical protein
VRRLFAAGRALQVRLDLIEAEGGDEGRRSLPPSTPVSRRGPKAHLVSVLAVRAFAGA